MKRRVVITAYSVINDLGKNRQAVEEGIFSGKSGISRQKFEYGDGVAEGYYGAVQDLTEVHPFFAAHNLPYDRCAQLALMAADDCIRESGLDVSREDPYRLGVSIGTSLGGMRLGNEFHKQWIHNGIENADAALLPLYPVHAVTDVVAAELCFKGSKNTISTACSASATSLGFAYDMIVNGSHDAFMAGGADPISEFSFAGFTALKAIDPDLCRPYSASTGINLAEGAAFFLMEEYEHAKARGAKILAEFMGYGITADAYHQTAPEPSGGGAARAMAEALTMSDIPVEDVSYVNGHGTGTHANDSAEPSAFRAIFKDRAQQVPLSSTKGATGHCLGAAGSVECAISIMAINKGMLPPTLRFDTQKYPPKLDFVPNEARAQDINVVLSNSFAFGGNNCCIALARAGYAKDREEAPFEDRIVITGMGCIGAGGMDVKSLFETFDRRDRRVREVEAFDTSKCRAHTEVAEDEPDWKKYIPIKFLRRTDTITKLTMASCRQALDSAKLTVNRQNMDRIGLVYGTGTGPMETIEKINRDCIVEGIHAVDPSAFPNSVLNQAPGNFSIANMLKGASTTISMSSASFLSAFAYACELIRTGHADAIVVTGSDELNQGLYYGFDKCGILSSNGAPAFSSHADGMLMGAGSAAFMLEKESAARARGAKILARVLSMAQCSDNSPLIHVDPEGEALKHCVSEALKAAGLIRTDLYIPGSCGTPEMDAAEEKVITELIDPATKISSAQAIVGTPLGACGGYSMLDALYAFEKGKVVNMPDGDYEIREGLKDRLHKGENEFADIQTAQINAIGFGGTYVSVILEKGEA